MGKCNFATSSFLATATRQQNNNSILPSTDVTWIVVWLNYGIFSHIILWEEIYYQIRYLKWGITATDIHLLLAKEELFWQLSLIKHSERYYSFHLSLFYVLTPVLILNVKSSSFLHHIQRFPGGCLLLWFLPVAHMLLMNLPVESLIQTFHFSEL